MKIGDSLDFGKITVDPSRMIVAARIKEEHPRVFRFAKYPDGSKKLQGGYVVSEGWKSWIEWGDLPCVTVDEEGNEI